MTEANSKDQEGAAARAVRVVPPTAAASTARGHRDGPIVCPHCGHELSLYTEPAEGRADRVARHLADGMGSWRFIAALCVVVVVYAAVALLTRPSGTGAAITMNYLGIAITVLVGVQTPLILLTQRRDVARDRARAQEALRVAAYAEADLHAIRAALEEADG